MLRHKKILFCCIAVACIIVIVTLFLVIKNKEDNSKEVSQLNSFDYNVYELFMKLSPIEELNVGPINNKETAIIKAEQVWELKFGPDGLEQIRANQKPYSVAYNPDKKMWLIQGHIEPNMYGGVAMTIIRDDGKVVLVWHGK